MNIIINNSSGEPIYSQIEEQIKNQILTNVLQAHEPLPSIRGLAKDLRISVITTKRAYDELEHEGFIYTLPGKGSFVNVQDKALLKETIMRNMEDYLSKALEEAQKAGISLDEVIETLKLLSSEN
ncbi:transcriptional regulator, GntR family [Hathewaya proteolytica DSM 3090]|uniref:Transcriptional regulator, GntR family n=1 Tax=Hathewaya proteolytica DSM 3090 TaxID=1121331 RepID=A0A1M6S6P5_9CLOT|nr:GntR family transcriptional regulator [Hathewaya proteolytica]SHK40376.1 transcriptional regulator, GntR family [Hathewaya proteolytica DSM 3090]